MDTSELICPILGIPMWDAVITSHNKIYSKRAILQHIRETKNPTDPLTRYPITKEELRPARWIREAASNITPQLRGWCAQTPIYELQLFSDIDLSILCKMISNETKITTLQLKHSLKYNNGPFPIIHHLCKLGCIKHLKTIAKLSPAFLDPQQSVSIDRGPPKVAAGHLSSRQNIGERLGQFLGCDSFEAAQRAKPIATLLKERDYDTLAEQLLGRNDAEVGLVLSRLSNDKTGKAYQLWETLGKPINHEVGLACPADVVFVEKLLRVVPPDQTLLLTERSHRFFVEALSEVKDKEQAWKIVRLVDQSFVDLNVGSLLHALAEVQFTFEWDWFADKRIKVDFRITNSVGATFVELDPERFMNFSFFRKFFRTLPHKFWETASDEQVKSESLERNYFAQVFNLALKRSTLNFAVFLDSIADIKDRHLLFKHCKCAEDLLLLKQYRFNGDGIGHYIARYSPHNYFLVSLAKSIYKDEKNDSGETIDDILSSK